MVVVVVVVVVLMKFTVTVDLAFAGLSCNGGLFLSAAAVTVVLVQSLDL